MVNEPIPIKIEITSDYKHGQVAAVLDNPKMWRRILRLRMKWGIKECHKSYIEWLKKLGQEAKDPLFKKEVSLLRKGFNLDPAYDKVLKMAIACNEVRDGDFKTTYWEPIPDPRDPSESNLRYAIIVTPDSQKEEVISVFLQFMKDVDYSRKRGQKLSYRYLYGLPRKVLNDTKSEIRKHRQWYWEHKRGKGFLQIAREDINRVPSVGVNIYEETIKEAVKSYKKLLNGVF